MLTVRVVYIHKLCEQILSYPAETTEGDDVMAPANEKDTKTPAPAAAAGKTDKVMT